MSRKKVLVRMVNNALHAGYLPPVRLLQVDSEALDLLDTEGRLLPLEMREVRSIAYVRDFNLDDAANPENLLRRTFLARPRTEGLWVRVTFTAGDQIEGLAALDLGLADGLIEDRGIFLIPPDTRSNTQRLFVPRTAMSSLQLIAVVTTPSKPAKRVVEKDTLQEELFPASDGQGTKIRG